MDGSVESGARDLCLQTLELTGSSRCTCIEWLCSHADDTGALNLSLAMARLEVAHRRLTLPHADSGEVLTAAAPDADGMRRRESLRPPTAFQSIEGPELPELAKLRTCEQRPRESALRRIREGSLPLTPTLAPSRAGWAHGFRCPRRLSSRQFRARPGCAADFHLQ